MDSNVQINGEPKYNGWFDIMRVKSLNIKLHSFYDEMPNDNTFVMVIGLFFDEEASETETENILFCDLNWCETFIMIDGPIEGADLELVNKERVLLWWFDENEVKSEIIKSVEMDHINDFAKDMILRYMEKAIKGINLSEKRG